MTVAVVGSGGRLGRSLADSLEARHEVIRIDRNTMDLASSRSIEETLAPLGFERLFLTGALTAVDYCETHADEARAVNSRAAGRIAAICADKGAHMTYISTDMVFDGNKEEPYAETDAPNPINVYGMSKLEGEAAVTEAAADHLIARVSWVFGPARPAFPEWIIDKACAGSDLTLPGDKICCPTYTLDLIDWLDALVFRPESGPAGGVFHLCNSRPCTWRDWGQFCIDAARDAGFPVIAREIQGVPVDSVPAFVAKRALNSALDTGKFTAATGIRPRDWREALRDFVMQSPTFSKYRLDPQNP